jgi:hypothetical protein
MDDRRSRSSAADIVRRHGYQSDFARRYFNQGRAEGRAEAIAEARAAIVLEVLEARGLDVPPAARDRIMACTDLVLLRRWLRSAVTCARVEDLFSG